MSQWRRNTDEIGQLSQTFLTLATSVEGMSDGMSAYEWALGAGNVTSAFQAIVNNWSVERDRLVEEMRSASDSLSKVAATYLHDETALAQAATPTKN